MLSAISLVDMQALNKVRQLDIDMIDSQFSEVKKMKKLTKHTATGNLIFKN